MPDYKMDILSLQETKKLVNEIEYLQNKNLLQELWKKQILRCRCFIKSTISSRHMTEYIIYTRLRGKHRSISIVTDKLQLNK